MAATIAFDREVLGHRRKRRQPSLFGSQSLLANESIDDGARGRIHEVPRYLGTRDLGKHHIRANHIRANHPAARIEVQPRVCVLHNRWRE